MRAGALRHLLTLQASTDVTSSHGVSQENWVDETNLWGSIKPLQGREGFAAQQMYASATHEIRVRYHAGISPKKRFTYGARVFDIDAVMNTNERNRELVCITTERNL